MNRLWPGFNIIVLSSVFFSAGVTVAAPKTPTKATVTFNKHIAPIVFQNCTVCHRPGEVAPFSLIRYRDVRKRAKQIQMLTERRYMPPWKVVPGHGNFIGARRLSNTDIDLIKQWVQQGAPEGEAEDLPAVPQFSSDWKLGKPDLIVKMPQAFEVPAEGPDIYRNFVLPFQIPEGKYLRAVQYRAGNPRVVHHAVLSTDTTGKARLLDNADKQPGFTQFTVQGRLLPGILGIWAPGLEPRPLPNDMAFAWPRKAELVLQLHLHPSGKAETEQSMIGFYFTDKAPTRRLRELILNQPKIDIPPGEKHYRTTVRKSLSADVEVRGFFPHMHLIGKKVQVTAHLPDGTRRSLLRIDDWDFNWQYYYECKLPVALPKGTELVLNCVHDNSATNPNNPYNPPRRVKFGLQTTNEMALAIVHLVPTNGNTRAAGETKKKTLRLEDDLATAAKKIIRRFDKNGDGKLNEKEITAIPGGNNRNFRGRVMSFDLNNDGSLNL